MSWQAFSGFVFLKTHCHSESRADILRIAAMRGTPVAHSWRWAGAGGCADTQLTVEITMPPANLVTMVMATVTVVEVPA
jgi:hypothetical protein